MFSAGFQVRAVELFCGAGGMSRGLIDAGFEVVGAFDSWPLAVENYCHNIAPHAEEADLSDVLSIVPRLIELAPDMICGGPPCQDYSAAGGHQEKENAELTLAFALVIVSARPEWFLMENVTQALTSRKWAQARGILKKAGYGITEVKIDCSRYGVPQARKRLIVVGRLGECDGFLDAAIREASADEQLSLRQAFSNTFGSMPDPGSPWNPDIAKVIAAGHVFTRPFYNGRGVRTVDEPFAGITRTSAEPPTGRFRFQSHPRDSALPTETADMTSYVMSRLQGFPHNWRWKAPSQRDLMQMIANAVPPPVIQTIGKVIARRQDGESCPLVEGRFLQWLVRGRRRSRATARNIKSDVGRARYILHGRTYADAALEIAALEAATGWNGLSRQTKSNLRRALCLYREFREARGRPQAPHAAEAVPAGEAIRRRPQRPRRLDLAALMEGVRSEADKYHSEVGATAGDGFMAKYVTS